MMGLLMDESARRSYDADRARVSSGSVYHWHRTLLISCNFTNVPLAVH
jgi:hypothetical protein